MIHTLKKRFYFIVAGYFAFWSKFVLKRWSPTIVVITGSSGKTSVLHLAEAQLGDIATYSHHANSAIGIPLHILGMAPNITSKFNWLKYFVVAPFHIFREFPTTKYYIVEADCDLPNEGAFTSKLLKPDITIWVSIFNTHSMNFDVLVDSKKFSTHEEAIAYEFGNFIANTKKLVLVNGDQPAINNQLSRVKNGVEVKTVSINQVSRYELSKVDTKFTISGQDYVVPGLNPRDLGLGIEMIKQLQDYFQLPIDHNFKDFILPEGRSNLLQGKNGLTIIDSTYNSGLGAITAMLEMFSSYPSTNRWAVIADILETGGIEKSEHEKLAELLATTNFQKIILLGRRNRQYTYPVLQAKGIPVEIFDSPKDVLSYIKTNATGTETILFKGAFGLEGVIEQLLANPDDATKLVRRSSVWIKRRQQWGLPK